MDQTSQPYILIVEDEPEIADLIRFHVEREGFRAKTVHSGKIAMDVIARDPPMLVMLDLMLPDRDGLEVCRQFKWNEQSRNIPILIVSAKGEESDVVTGIELGADDYVTKPFGPKELMARVKNIVRRVAAMNEPARSPGSAADGSCISLADGSLVIDLDRHVVMVRAIGKRQSAIVVTNQNRMPNAERIDLTLTEFGILHFLALKPGFVRTRDQIIKHVHGQDRVLSSRTIDVHVTALRRKLGPLGAAVETVRGVGYRLTEPATMQNTEA